MMNCPKENWFFVPYHPNFEQVCSTFPKKISECRAVNLASLLRFREDFPGPEETSGPRKAHDEERKQGAPGLVACFPPELGCSAQITWGPRVDIEWRY